ncbi:LysR family transcriptional regulator [Micromonospora sp. NPDC093277]|uniref:LysR family transcriptional regulator n=1 Tax=Micromonospora sp. NPDC093277 TaxID=3364291 RepID=UPI00381D4304
MHGDPGQLQLLALIRAHGSLAGAAHELGVTPAAVSGQLARAEADWNTPLVVRGPRGARLTEPGHVLADAGDAVIEQCTRAADRVSAMLGPLSRRLRIGTFQAAAQHLLPPALTALRHQRRDAELTIVEITSDRGVDLVDTGQLDVAVIASYGTTRAVPPTVRTHPLLTDPMALCLPEDHPLIRRQRTPRGLRLDQLADDPWIVIVAGHAARRQLDQAATDAGFTPCVQFETENYNVAQSLVGTGIGVTMLSRLTITPTPGAVHRELTRPRLSRRIHAVTASTALTPLAEHFVALLSEVSTELADRWAATPVGV